MTSHTIITRSIRRFLRARGYAITRFPFSQQAPVDLRCGGNDPRSFAYLDGPILIDAPLSRGRGLHNYALRRDGPHPFVRAVCAMRQWGPTQTGEQREAIRHLLEGYYRHVQPASFAEWMGISVGRSALHDIPPWAGPFPWETRNIAETRRDRAGVALRESARDGIELPISAGWQFVGPIAPDKVALEVERLRKLALSMANRGFRRSARRTGDVVGTVLWSPDRPHDPWRWIVHDGHHRTAVAAAIGLDALPLRIIRLVRRDEAAAWPNVLSGLYSLEAALETFDGQFAEDPPPVAAGWLAFLNQTRPPGYATCSGTQVRPEF